MPIMPIAHMSSFAEEPPYLLFCPAVTPTAAARLLHEGTEVCGFDSTAAPVLHPEESRVI